MIPPVLAASAATAALGAISSVADAVATERNDRNDRIDRADFLTLLVAQLQAQDPLNPLEAADFSAQLAQFSSLEQLISIDGRLEQMATAGRAGSSDAVSFLGREVAVGGGKLGVSGGDSGAVAFTLPQAGAVTLSISDASGVEVASVDLGVRQAGRHSVDLDEVDGAPDLEDGQYSVRLRLRGEGGDVRDVEALVFGRVTGVDLSSDPPVLFIGDRRVPLAEVSEVREARGAEKA
jgi:flagellar basal-body rod modification protein FlgD